MLLPKARRCAYSDVALIVDLDSDVVFDASLGDEMGVGYRFGKKPEAGMVWSVSFGFENGKSHMLRLGSNAAEYCLRL
jgi:hypothetical protein